MEKVREILVKIKDMGGVAVIAQYEIEEALMELAAFRETFEAMKKLEEELKGVNPDLTLIKLITTALEER